MESFESAVTGSIGVARLAGRACLGRSAKGAKVSKRGRATSAQDALLARSGKIAPFWTREHVLIVVGAGTGNGARAAFTCRRGTAKNAERVRTATTCTAAVK